MDIEYLASDGHKEYSLFVGMDRHGKFSKPMRIEHDRETYRSFLRSLPPGLPIALEATGFYYWMVDEMEAAGHRPVLTNAGKAKLMMGEINKTDKLDARGLATLLRNGTIPEVWIPTSEVRDERELHRTRMSFTNMRTRIKNRIHATFAKYLIELPEVRDVFGKKGLAQLQGCVDQLPPETKKSILQQLELLASMEEQIKVCEKRIQEVVKVDPMMKLLRTIPGIGEILSVVISREVGDVSRFATAEKLAAYSGVVPRVFSSGGRTTYGRSRPDVNRHLKWAFIEAANSIVSHQKYLEGSYALALYRRIRERKGHGIAAMATARHLAEATFWVLKKQEAYLERGKIVRSSRTE